MMPIHDLLNRIKWDQEFGRADFVIGYHDRIANKIVSVQYRDMHFLPDEHFAFVLTDHDGAMHHIPFHRVRAVYRNGELIWHRSPLTA